MDAFSGCCPWKFFSSYGSGRLGGNTDRQRERVVAAFEKQKTTAEIAEILKTLYHGGNGLGSVSAWYAEDGIHLSHGKDVYKRQVVGKCPRCGGDVAELQKGFFCQTESCKFAIWKNNKWWEMKRNQPTKAIVTALLKEGRAHVSGLYSEKTGKIYDATVVLVDDGKYVGFKLEFDRQKGGKR